MNEFADILNLFIANVIAYTFFVAVYGFIIYNVGKIIFYLVRYTILFALIVFVCHNIYLL